MDDEIKRLDALLEYAVIHGDGTENDGVELMR